MKDISNPIKRQMDQFDIIKHIGKGTYANVFKVHKNNEKYALKKFIKHDSDLGDEGIHTTTMREISLILMCDHPNIITIIDWDFDYMVIPLYNISLDKYIGLNDLDTNQIKHISKQLLEAVHYLHCHGIIHRDIKPPNILVNSDNNEICLTDFGMARTIDPYQNQHPTTPSVCTLWYRPPEVIHQEDYSFKVDSWSVGCVIGEMIKGTSLFKGHDDLTQMLTIYQTMGLSYGTVFNGERIYKMRGNYEEIFEGYDEDLVDLLKKSIVY